jgi:hypothetical protein
MPVIFLSRAVIGPGIFRGIEALLGALARGGMPAGVGVHAIYAVLIYTTGFAAWELPRMRGQSAAQYAASWRRGFAELDPNDFPLTGTILPELPLLAGTEQYETGLAALVSGLNSGRDTK